MSTDSNAKIFSVIGGCRRNGRWIVPAKTNMMTLFGRAVIDLREARTSAEELEFTCLSVFANITFLVPEGAEVRPSGMAILGSSRSTVPSTVEPCHLPPISIDATTVIGRLRIRTTDVDPDDTGKRRFRRKAQRADQAARAATDSAPSPVGEPQPQRSRVSTSTQARATDRGPSHAAPTPHRPAESSPSASLTDPIPPFRPDEERSPIHGVDVPATIEGTAADPDASGPEAPIEGVDTPGVVDASVPVLDAGGEAEGAGDDEVSGSDHEVAAIADDTETNEDNGKEAVEAIADDAAHAAGDEERVAAMAGEAETS